MSGVPEKAAAYVPEADASGISSREAGVPVRGPSASAVPGAAVPEHDAPKDGTPERAAPEPPVPGPVGIDELLERVRAGYERIGPAEAAEAAAAGALLVDIRYAALRERDGLIPGALVVERNELEWRLDPRGSHRAAEAVGHDLRIVVVCNEGYASSLAVASLRQLGLHRATDLIGGFQAWRAAGLPVASPPPA
ncbi:rhodanese-related sulfurtransferase [Streptomyces sp. DSM 41269]|nr:rhodanese-related sulfurtransferase [Streptomyces sp. DSM 41269]